MEKTSVFDSFCKLVYYLSLWFEFCCCWFMEFCLPWPLVWSLPNLVPTPTADTAKMWFFRVDRLGFLSFHVGQSPWWLPLFTFLLVSKFQQGSLFPGWWTSTTPRFFVFVSRSRKMSWDSRTDPKSWSHEASGGDPNDLQIILFCRSCYLLLIIVVFVLLDVNLTCIRPVGYVYRMS